MHLLDNCKITWIAKSIERFFACVYLLRQSLKIRGFSVCVVYLYLHEGEINAHDARSELSKHYPCDTFQNLAISDLLFVTICIPSTAISYARDWPFGDVFCRLFQYINYVTCYGSVITLILLSLDRYLAVVYPVKSISWRTVCNTSMIIIVTWIITLAVCSPILWIHKAIDLEYGNWNTICR